MTDFSTDFQAPAPIIAPEEPFSEPDPQAVAALADGMDQIISRASDNPQLRILRVNGVPIRLADKLSAVAMANLSKGLNNDDFSLILDAVRRLVHRTDRNKFDEWLEGDDEPGMEEVMEFMQLAMEQITGKASATS